MSSDNLGYLRIEEHPCPRCNKPTPHLVTDEAFEAALGLVCKECGLVWHYNNMGGACPHGEVPSYAVRTAYQKLSPEEKRKRKEAEKKIVQFLGPDVMKCIEHENKMWDIFWRLERGSSNV